MRVEVVGVPLSWANTLDAMMAMATKVERVKRGIVLKSGGGMSWAKGTRERRRKET